MFFHLEELWGPHFVDRFACSYNARLPRFNDCKTLGSLIVPMWKSAQFWPLLCSDGVHLNSFVKDCLFIPNRPDLFVKGRAQSTLFGTKALKSRCLAIRIDFATVGFCTSPKGWCPVCRS